MFDLLQLRKTFPYLAWSIFTLIVAYALVLFTRYEDSYYFMWSLMLVPYMIGIGRFPSYRNFFIFFGFILIAQLLTELFLVEGFHLVKVISSGIVNGILAFTTTSVRIRNHEVEQRLQNMVLSDSLTGVPNRRYLNLYLEQAIPFSMTNNHAIQILALDIDNFKQLNDSHGHLFGDKVLKQVASSINKNVRDTDCFARYGGEEFSLIMINTSHEDAIFVAERIRKKVENMRFAYKKKTVRVTISIGVSQCDLTDTPDQMFEKADSALYKAKSNGRNCVVSYSLSASEVND